MLYELVSNNYPDKIAPYWEPKHTEAFEDLKESLAETTKLALPDYGPEAEPMILTVDSSLEACGIMLSQIARRPKGEKWERIDCPIAFGS